MSDLQAGLANLAVTLTKNWQEAGIRSHIRLFPKRVHVRFETPEGQIDLHFFYERLEKPDAATYIDSLMSRVREACAHAPAD